MILTKKLIYKPSESEEIILGLISYASAKLWNIGNYEKHHYKELGFEKYPNWYEQKRRLKSEFWYKNLPSQTAQEVLHMLEKSWKSFFKLRKTGGVKNPNPPRYKKSNNFKYLNNGFKINGDTLRFSLPKALKIHLRDRYQIEDNYLTLKIKGFSALDLKVKEIEFKPLKHGRYQINITHEVEVKTTKEDNDHYLSIDLGISNMMTCYDNQSGKSFIISGKQWLSINRYFDKKIGRYQSISDAQQSGKGVKYPKKSKRVLALYEKRSGQIHHLLHSATREIVYYCKANDISKVIIGDITHIREDANHGRVKNQKLHKFPFAKIYSLLDYKLRLEGIEMIKQKEAYSSQCSPLSPEVSKAFAQKQNRKSRGLYKDGQNIFNADSVGAYNIMRLYFQKIEREFEGETRFLSSPTTLSFDQTSKYLCNASKRSSSSMGQAKKVA